MVLKSIARTRLAMNRPERRPRGFQPASESLETRVVLSLQAPSVELIHNVLFGSLGSQPVRPNTPVAPYAAASKPTFIDPTVSISKGKNIAIGSSDYVAPYATLDARGGLIVVGSGSTIGDSANVLANPNHNPNGFGVIIGDNVLVQAGATIIGPGVIGAAKGANVSIGANSVIDNATVQPGAEVGALARVEPGVVIKTGFAVLPGADVQNQAQADNPSLGKVVRLTGTDTILATTLADNVALATGYSAQFQGSSATGSTAGTTLATVFAGSLAPVTGSSSNPGTGAGSTFVAGSPKFFAPNNTLITSRVYTSPFYPFRVIGSVTFTKSDPFAVSAAVGKHTTIRSDIDVPISIGAIGSLGSNVSIHGNRSGKITIGDHLHAANNVVLGADSAAVEVIGNDVSIGNGSVVSGSNIGNGVTIGNNSVIIGSKVAAGTVIPGGTIMVNNKVIGKFGY